MSQELVTTKLHPPRTRPNLITRPRLRELLDRGEGRRLTLVSAPAGFGKTTLLAESLEARSGEGSAVAWLSLDEADNDPARFLTYLVSAIRTVEAGVGERVLASLRSPEMPPVDAVMGALINELARVARTITVVLDDYHVIESGTVHEIVSFLLERLPPNVRLAISSRTDPPLPLPKLRARDQTAEIRAADLRCTPEEATAFLGEAMGLTLAANDVAALEKVTEGWIAGLQLAALSMQDRENVSGFVGSFSGSNRHIVDFLAEEVLERQPEDVREFLLATSVLARMTAPLCDALTGHTDGQEMLEGLERKNLFVVSLDDERRWYRYHHLFAGFLRGRLKHADFSRAGELHLRACIWYEGAGHLGEAIEHALAAPDHDLAARLIERGVRAAGGRGEIPTALRWLEALPAEAKRHRPRLFVDHASALALLGRPNEAESLLIEVEQAAALTGEDRRILLGFASAVRSWCARLRGDAPAAARFARRAISLLPAEEAQGRNFAAICMGDALRAAGDLAAASAALAEATEIGLAAGHTYGTLSAMSMHAGVQAERGRLREADETLRRALRFVSERGIELLPATGLVHIGLGALLYERNDLAEAEREVTSGVELAELAGDVTDLVWGYVTLSRTRWARGNHEGALEMARKADRVARASGADPEIAIAHAWMARLRLASGEFAEASTFERRYAAGAGSTPGAAWVVRMTAARLLHARGQHHDALRQLETLRETADLAERTGSLIEILALQALALWTGNGKERAVNTLTQALALSEPEGYVRTFVDEGPAMRDLLLAILEARQGGRLDAACGVSTHYIAKLIASLAQEAQAPVRDERLAEFLSEREAEILALIAAGESNAEIAARLFVSTSTVKTHINNLYRKLDARSRTQAVARAREMSLL